MKCSQQEHNSFPYQYLDVKNNSLILKCQICYLFENEQQQEKMVLLTDKEKVKMQIQNIYQNTFIEQQQLHATLEVKMKEWHKQLDQIGEQFQQYAEQQIQINQSSLEETIKLIQNSEGIFKILDIQKENEKKMKQISESIYTLMNQVQKGLGDSLKYIYQDKYDAMLKQVQLKYKISDNLISQFKNLIDCLEDLSFEHNNYNILLTEKPDQIYIGGVNEYNYRHGLGMSLNSTDNQFCNGFWIDNHFYQGNILELTKKELFKGTIQQIDNKYTINGDGFWTNEQSETYNGEFLMGKFEGFGVKINKDKQKYQGNFKQGMYHGKGKLQFDDKTTFDGNFIDGHINGKGEFICEEYIYEGGYQNDLKQGQGTYFEIKTKIKYQGEFVKNERHGQGILEIPNKQYKYTGQFQNGQQNGEGQEEYFIEQMEEDNSQKKQITGIQQLIIKNIRVVEQGHYIKDQKHDIFLCQYFQEKELIKQWQQFNCIQLQTI